MSSPLKPKVLLLIPHLGGGGAERVIETLSQALSPLKYEVHLALIAPLQGDPPRLQGRATIHELRAGRVRYSASSLLRLIWQLRPSLIFAGIAHLNLLVLALKPLLPRKTRIVVRQNGALNATLASHPLFFARKLYSLGYRRADRVICQSQPMAREMRKSLGVERAKLLVLHNPTDIRSLRTTSCPNPKQIAAVSTLLSIGRLVPEKGFDLLLAALASLSPRFRSTELIIVGSGSQQSRLQEQSQRLGIHHRVHFAGHVPSPVIQFRHASLFVLPSRTEGLSNALLEAAAAGLPIVATPASDGVVDLLRHREGVWLASEVSSRALRAALEQALSHIHPGQHYSHPWIEPFDLPSAMAAYEAALDNVLAESAP